MVNFFEIDNKIIKLFKILKIINRKDTIYKINVYEGTIIFEYFNSNVRVMGKNVITADELERWLKYMSVRTHQYKKIRTD